MRCKHDIHIEGIISIFFGETDNSLEKVATRQQAGETENWGFIERSIHEGHDESALGDSGILGASLQLAKRNL